MSVTSPHVASIPATDARHDARVRAWQRGAALAILLFAFALRIWGLTTQSMWSDEGISVNRSLLPFGEMLARMPVEHAPGYFVALGGWLRIVGVSATTIDFVLRYFSLLPDLLSIALLLRLVLELARPHAMATWIALAAALLFAVSPIQVWYAQEGRMYTWLVACVLLSTLALWRILRTSPPRQWRWVALYAVATAACVYLHYFGALAAIAQAIYVAIWAAGTGRWRKAGAWLVGAFGALLFFAPWLPRALGIFGFSGWREEGSISAIPLTYLRAYLVDHAPPEIRDFALILFVAVALLGALWWTLRRAESGLLLLLLVAVPMVAVVVLAVRDSDYHPRYTLFVVAPLVTLVGAGVVAAQPAAWRREGAQVARLWTLVSAALLTVLVALSLAATWRLQTDPALFKPDFRGAVAQISAQSRAGDVILVDGPDPELVIQRYYTGDLPLVDLRDAADLSSEEIDARLRTATTGADRAWELLYFHDPAGVQVWTATQAYASAPEYHQGIRVTLYGLEGPAMTATPLNLAVGDALTLITGTVQSQARAGDLVRVRTDWHTVAQAPEMRFSLRMTGSDGQTVASDDYVPQNWFAPTNVWLVDAPARDQRALRIPANLPPGDYTITLRLYDPATGVAVETAMGADIPLGSVEVTP